VEHPDHGPFCQLDGEELPALHYHGTIKPPASKGFPVVCCSAAERNVLQSHVEALWEASRRSRRPTLPANVQAIQRAFQAIGFLQWLEGHHADSMRRKDAVAQALHGR